MPLPLTSLPLTSPPELALSDPLWFPPAPCAPPSTAECGSAARGEDAERGRLPGV